jgi:DNA end-binding protein Ku
MTTTFADLDLEDTYEQALKQLIQEKLEGKEVVQIGEPERPVTDIMTALKESIEQAKEHRKPMVKATGKKAKEEPAAKTRQSAKAEGKPAKARRSA